jgi:hypothetical protein
MKVVMQTIRSGAARGSAITKVQGEDRRAIVRLALIRDMGDNETWALTRSITVGLILMSADVDKRRTTSFSEMLENICAE